MRLTNLKSSRKWYNWGKWTLLMALSGLMDSLRPRGEEPIVIPFFFYSVQETKTFYLYFIFLDCHFPPFIMSLYRKYIIIVAENVESIWHYYFFS